jgi:hypothetical protein
MEPSMEGQKWLWGAQTIYTVGLSPKQGSGPMARHAVTGAKFT